MLNHRDTLEDGNLTKSWYIKQNIAELACAVFNIIGLGIGFVAYDIDNDLQGFTQTSIFPLNKSFDFSALKFYLYWTLLMSTICLSIFNF